MSDLVPLPTVPIPAPPRNPACDWCGDRPAERYEVEPPIYTTVKRTAQGGEKSTARIVKKRAVTAYACRRHRDLFDAQKAARTGA